FELDTSKNLSIRIFVQLSVNAEELILEFRLQTSAFGLLANYDLDGEAILFNSTTFSPIYGSGNATHVFSGVITNHTVQTTTITVDDVEYLTVKSYNVSLAADHQSVQLTNLYNGEDPKAAALAKALIDANSDALMKGSLADFNRYFADLFGSYLEKLIQSVPKKDIFV
ncbi:hypothetical protein JTB14_019437, partial [Gonioctena quinquepunctata]